MGLVLGDGVPMQRVGGGDHLPRQPARAECLVAGEHEGDVARLCTAAAIVVGYGFCDGLHLTLVAVSPYRARERERAV